MSDPRKHALRRIAAGAHRIHRPKGIDVQATIQDATRDLQPYLPPEARTPAPSTARVTEEPGSYLDLSDLSRLQDNPDLAGVAEHGQMAPGEAGQVIHDAYGMPDGPTAMNDQDEDDVGTGPFRRRV